MFSHTEENYLKTIYHLQLDTGKVTTNALAQQLNTKPATVTDMMKKLHAKNLLHYTPYYGFSLSNEGKKAALFIVRRHRLWEAFLAEKLAFPPEEVHEIAEELEHVRHAKLVERLDAFLGYPQFDPHGDPIPDKKGKVPQSQLTNLGDLPIGTVAVLQAVAQQTKPLLAQLSAKKIAIGSQLEVRSRSPFDQMLEIKIDNKIISISAQLASHLLVKKQPS
ncbi:metal-dependent transcriptional regulator [Pseudocnuella soli]|uniref:metal-dependent transcriptional regulator n=1 Tax=Pseudocnuella soli TaxID=2502779 RepID=UPI00104BD5D8|nr:metal-dependent transcriptional regulator [Pseudocnuella soli]